MISFSEERQALPSALPPARYLMKDSGILVILLAGCSSSIRQGSSSGSGAWRSSSCLRMPPGLVDASIAPSPLSAISSLFRTANLGFLSTSASMSCRLGTARAPRGASSVSSGRAKTAFSGFWRAAGEGCGGSGAFLSSSMLWEYFLMTSASIWQASLRANFLLCVAGLGFAGRKSLGQ